MHPSSLSRRLILSSALVSMVLLAATGLILASLFAAALERNFDERLRAVMDGVLANLEVTDSGAPKLTGALADPRFGLPLSGWYWQVTPLDGGKDLASASLLEQRLAAPAGGGRGRRAAVIRGTGLAAAGGG